MYSEIPAGTPHAEKDKTRKKGQNIYFASLYPIVDKLLSHLYVQLWVRIHVVKQLLVVVELLIPLQRLVVAKVISQRDQKHLAAVEFGLLTVLIQEQVCPD